MVNVLEDDLRLRVLKLLQVNLIRIVDKHIHVWHLQHREFRIIEPQVNYFFIDAQDCSLLNEVKVRQHRYNRLSDLQGRQFLNLGQQSLMLNVHVDVVLVQQVFPANHPELVQFLVLLTDKISTKSSCNPHRFSD